MNTLRRFWARLRNAAAGRSAGEQQDQRFREEMEAHLAAQTEDNLRSGMSPREARRAARLKFGAPEAFREQYHAERGLPIVPGLASDMRYVLRVLRNSPSFVVVAVVTLMLGICANVVVFGVLNAVVLRPLEVSNPGNLYQLRHQQWSVGRLLTTSYPAFEDLRRRNTTFSGMAAINAYSNGGLRWGARAVQAVSGEEVTGNYFDLLGVQPEAGRLFHAGDIDGPDSAPYIVLSDTFWRSTFQADPSVIGRTVELSGHPFTVAGVASARFHGTERFVWPDYWIPMANEDQAEGYDYLQNRASVAVTVIGRLKPGVTPRQATDNLNAITAQLAREYPQTDRGVKLRLIHPGLMGDEGDVIRGFLWSVAALALLVLAAACANLAGLFAARTADRSREMALRVALGTSRGRLVRQPLTEALLVSLAGGAAALAAAQLLLDWLNRWRPSFGGHLAIGIDARVYVAGLVLSLGSALVFGLLPARHACQSNPAQMLKSGPADGPHPRRFALRDVLLGVQIAICTLLITASLVAVRGMERELHVPLGFQPKGAMLVDLDLSGIAQPGQSLVEKQDEVMDAARNIPGVIAVGAVSRTPMTGGLHGVPIFLPGTTEFTLDHSVLSPYVFSMSPGYLAAAGTRLLRGRDLLPTDTVESPYVAVVNQTFARSMWGRSQALGRRFILAGHLTQVVGVAQDGKYHDLTESPAPVAYVPFSQSLEDEASFVVRSPRAPSEMTAALEHALTRVAPNVPISVQSWSESLDGEIFPARAAAVALGVMGLLAAMLALTGIFGMAAYSVSKRKKELGIRMALGAGSREVMRAAVGRPMVLLALGAAAGVFTSFFMSRLLGHIVYRADPGDPVVVAGAVLAMALLGLAATAIPARRALAVDPSKLLRED
jgi:predicted permease